MYLPNSRRQCCEALTEDAQDLGFLPVIPGLQTLTTAISFGTSIYQALFGGGIPDSVKRQVKEEAKTAAAQYIYSMYPQYLQLFQQEVARAAAEAQQASGAMMTATGSIAVRLGENVKTAAEKVRTLVKQAEGGQRKWSCCGVPPEIRVNGGSVGSDLPHTQGFPLNPYLWGYWQPGPTNYPGYTVYQPVGGWPEEVSGWMKSLWDPVMAQAQAVLEELEWIVRKIPAFALEVKAPVVTGESHTLYVQPPPPRPGFFGEAWE